METTFDTAKRAATLLHRGLDFIDAAIVSAGFYVTQRDARSSYGEDRFTTVGALAAKILFVWTGRDDSRRIISLRKADRND